MKHLKRIATAIICAFMLVGVSFVMTACGGSSNEGAKSICNLSYNGETISWDSVKNAKNYKLSLNGTQVIVPQTKNKVTYRYNANGENFEFSIEAVIKDGSDKNPKYSLTFTNIGQVTGLKVENGMLVWDPLEKAEKYEIMFNGDIMNNMVGVPSYAINAGKFSYKVRAVRGTAEMVDGNNPYYSVWSDKIDGTVLAAPKNLKYNSETFTWEKVTGATGYKIKIGNQEYETTTNSYDYTASTEDFAVSVCALGKATDKIYDSQYCEAKQYTYIAPIEGLRVKDGNLIWTAPENAVRYKIKINGTVNNDELTTNEYTALSSGSTYNIQILPIGKSDFYFSRWSNEIVVNILASPVVDFNDNVIKWSEVYGCAGYEVKITKDGEVVDTKSVGSDVKVYNYAFNDAGDYRVQVKATSLATGGVYESKYSTAYSVKRLATPTNKRLTNTPLDEHSQVSVTFTGVVGATGYKLLANGVQIASTNKETQFLIDLSDMYSKINNESVINFKVVAVGGLTSSGTVLDSKSPLEFSVTRLATPQNLSNNGLQLSWTAVNNTSKYVVTIDGKRTEVTSTTYTMTNITEGEHVVYVQSMGNGEDVVTSAYSNGLNLKKLPKPTNLTINNGVMTWSQVTGHSGYIVQFGTNSKEASSNSLNLDEVYSQISEGQGMQITVRAKGNGSTLDSDSSDTRTISKYARPTNLQINGDNLVWNAPTLNSVNCNNYKLTITGGMSKIENLTGTSYALSNFNPGNYTVSVVACGDNVNTVDSPSSNSFTFTKLANISGFTKSGNKYTWDAVTGATGYQIKLSEDATWTTINTNEYVPTFTANHSRQVKVTLRALGNGSNIVNSNDYSFEQTIKAITQYERKGDLTTANAFTVQVTGNTITVTMNKVAGITDYKLFISGGDSRENFVDNGTTVTFTYTMTSKITYNVQVKAIGGLFDTSGVYLIDSELSADYEVTYNG